MWIFSTIGFFSIVTDSTRKGRILIRARTKTDIDNLFRSHRETCASMEPPTSDEARDYRYRLSISKRDWMKLAAKLAEQVEYNNFKMAVHERPDQADKTAAYSEIWWTMRRVQMGESNERPVKQKAGRQQKE